MKYLSEEQNKCFVGTGELNKAGDSLAVFLDKYLSFVIAVSLAYVCVTGFHSFVTADYYYAHILYPFCCILPR